MAAPTADLINFSAAGSVLTLPVAASTIVYLNEHCGYNSSGYIVPMGSTTGIVYMGYSLLHADNSASATNGAINTQVQLFGFGVENTLWYFNFSGTPTAATAGVLVYFSDAQTVTTTSGSNAVAGLVAQVVTPGVANPTNGVLVNVGRRSAT